MSCLPFAHLAFNPTALTREVFLNQLWCKDCGEPFPLLPLQKKLGVTSKSLPNKRKIDLVGYFTLQRVLITQGK